MAITVFKAGSYGTDTLSTIIQLWGFVATDGNVSHLRLPHTTAGYQVTAGKTLHMVRVMVTGTGNPGWWKFGYADNDVGLNAGTARTNGVMALGVDDTGNNGALLTSSSNATVGLPQITEQANLILKLSIAAKYLFVRRVGATPNDTILVWAVEV